MILNAWKSFMARRERASAIQVRARFGELMEFIESDRMEAQTREMIASGFVALISKFGELARETLAPHLQENYMIFLDPKAIGREAESLAKQAKKNELSEDPKRVLLGTIQELASLYLLSRSWTDRVLPQGNGLALLNSPSIVRAQVKEGLSRFLDQFSQLIPK